MVSRLRGVYGRGEGVIRQLMVGAEEARAFQATGEEPRKRVLLARD
jgi:hypothetical protein